MSSSNISASIAAAAAAANISANSYAPVMLPPRGNNRANNKRKSVIMHEEKGFVQTAIELLGPTTTVNSSSSDSDFIDLLPEIERLERRAMAAQSIETELQTDIATLLTNLKQYQKENNSFRSEAAFQRFLSEFYMEAEDLEFALKRIQEASIVKYLRTTTTTVEEEQSKAKIEIIAVESY